MFIRRGWNNVQTTHKCMHSNCNWIQQQFNNWNCVLYIFEQNTVWGVWIINDQNSKTSTWWACGPVSIWSEIYVCQCTETILGNATWKTRTLISEMFMNSTKRGFYHLSHNLISLKMLPDLRQTFTNCQISYASWIYRHPGHLNPNNLIVPNCSHPSHHLCIILISII